MMSKKLSGKTPKEEMGLDRKWLYYFTRAWAAAIKMGLSLHERAAAIISPTTWYFVPGLPRLSNVVTINPKKQKTTQEKAYLLIRYVLFHCLFYLCILYFRSLLHLDLKCYSLEGGRKMEWSRIACVCRKGCERFLCNFPSYFVVVVQQLTHPFPIVIVTHIWLKKDCILIAKYIYKFWYKNPFV